MKTVDIIGIGNMGLPMLKALQRVDFDVVASDLRPEAKLAAAMRPWMRAMALFVEILERG